MKEELTRRLKAIKELSERGVGGERDNAQYLLETIMKKHGVSDDDLNDEKRTIEYFKFSTKIGEKLLSQVIYMIMGACDFYSQKSNRNNHVLKKTGVKCSVAEKLEIITAYEFYKNAFEKELNYFYSAFIAKNDIYPPVDKTNAGLKPSVLTIDEQLKRNMMMQGIDCHTLHKMIE